MDKILVPPPKKEEKINYKYENVSINNINKSLKDEINNIYNKSWVKLDRGSKINKLKEYAIEKSIPSSELIDFFNKGFLNKKEIINYDIENGKINSISSINFQTDGSYKFIYPKKKMKQKSTVKSKSNIERILNSKS